MFMYGDVKCPHCGEINRVRFKVRDTFGTISLVVDGAEHCSKCKDVYMPKVDIVFGSRLLQPSEKRRYGT